MVEMKGYFVSMTRGHLRAGVAQASRFTGLGIASRRLKIVIVAFLAIAFPRVFSRVLEIILILNSDPRSSISSTARSTARDSKSRRCTSLASSGNGAKLEPSLSLSLSLSLARFASLAERTPIESSRLINNDIVRYELAVAKCAHSSALLRNGRLKPGGDSFRLITTISRGVVARARARIKRAAAVVVAAAAAAAAAAGW